MHRQTEGIVSCTEGKFGEDAWHKEADTKLIE